VVAAHHRKKTARVGKSSLFDILDPGSIDADRNFVFRFTRHRAGMTTDTFAVIDDKTVIHIKLLFPTGVSAHFLNAKVKK
jgi:hypothetical protein